MLVGLWRSSWSLSHTCPVCPIPHLRANHGGDIWSAADRQRVSPFAFLDASASLAPTPRWLSLQISLSIASQLRPYPDPTYHAFRDSLSLLHGLDPSWFLPGNGAAELFTWVARDSAAEGMNLLPQPGFSDYERALRCWDAPHSTYQLPTWWNTPSPRALSEVLSDPLSCQPQCLWVTQPHNPTGLLWDTTDLLSLLSRYAMVVVDEAFLPLVPQGEERSLIPHLDRFPNLVVIRSLTKLYGLAGLRLGYAVAHPDRLRRWSAWRDPWTVNSVAAELGRLLLSDPNAYRRHCSGVQSWSTSEGVWWRDRLDQLPGLTPLPSVANFVLVRAGSPDDASPVSLRPLLEGLEARHRVLLRDCRSFIGLGEGWFRLGYQRRPANRMIYRALEREWQRFVGG